MSRKIALFSALLLSIVSAGDVGVTVIKAPVGIIDSGTTITPACSVYNYGTGTETYTVNMQIGSSYTSTATVTGHVSHTYLYVTFPAWTAIQVGTHAVTCSTRLAFDSTPSNDARRDSVRVVVPTVFTTPPYQQWVVDSTTAYRVFCWETDSARPGKVMLGRDSLVYTDSICDTNRTRRHEVYLDTVGWSTPFHYRVKSGSEMSADYDVPPMDPPNSISFLVYGDNKTNHADHQAVVNAMVPLLSVYPPASLRLNVGDLVAGDAESEYQDFFTDEANLGGIPLLPALGNHEYDWYSGSPPPYWWCKNFGLLPNNQRWYRYPFANCMLYCLDDHIEDDYYHGDQNTPPGEEYRWLHDWLDKDNKNPYVDHIFVWFHQPIYTSQPSLTDPHGPNSQGQDYLYPLFTTDKVRIVFTGHNHWYERCQLDNDKVHYITTGGGGAPLYDLPSPLQPYTKYAEKTLEFLKVDVTGMGVVCEAYRVPTNPQETFDQVWINAVPPDPWIARRTIPVVSPSTQTKVKKGGALTYLDVPPDAHYVYAFAGWDNRFMRYEATSPPKTNPWSGQPFIPPLGSTGTNKYPRDGSCLVTDSGDYPRHIFAAKGHNSREWWRFDPDYASSGEDWIEKTSVPLGATRLRKGTSAASAVIGGRRYIYLLKASNTTEFYRYDVVLDLWAAMTPAPLAPSGQPYREGSCIAYDSDRRVIYALKGKYAEFYKYEISSGQWFPLASLPLGFPIRRPGYGASLAYHNGVVYCLKGKNRNDFWIYDCLANAWQKAPDMPTGPHRVKNGAALVFAPPLHALYAFRGNNTNEFWECSPAGVSSFLYPVLGKSDISDVAESPVLARRPALSLAPNPSSKVATISYSLPVAGNVSLKLYDRTGRLVALLVRDYRSAGPHSYRLEPLRLARGVYLVRLEAAGVGLTKKLVVR